MRDHIVADLRAIGCSAEPFGDAYVIVGRKSKNYVLRVVEKVDASATPATAWRGDVRIVRSIEEARDLFIRMR